MKELVEIQSKLKAPKGQFNKFGGYRYRSCEDILEAVKPLLAQTGCILTLTDGVEQVGDRYYVRAFAQLTNDKGQTVSVLGYAREEDSKKGMDASQLTGAASSYARKYALNGLFAIDDTKDADATNTHGVATVAAPAPTIDEDVEHAIMCCTTTLELSNLWKQNIEAWKSDKAIIALVNRRKDELNK